MNIFYNHDEDRMRAGWRLAVQFFLMFVIGMLVAALLGRFISISNTVLGSVALAIGAFASIFMAARGLDKRSWSDFGLQLNKHWVLECAAGFALAGVVMALIFLIEYSSGWLSVSNFGWNHPVNGLYGWSLAGYFLWMIVVGFYEELVFRGYQLINLAEGLYYPSLTRRQATICALLLSSIIFGVAHASNPNVGLFSILNIAIAGVMLALPFLLTGRLSISIGLHIGWDFFQGGVFGFPVSGLPSHAAVLHITQKGPAIITGGAFGPEAGLMGLWGLLLIIAVLCFYFKKYGGGFDFDSRFGKYMPESRHYPT